MSQSERDFIRENARRLEESMDSPRPFSDPFDDMSSEEKSKLILLLQDMLSQARSEAAAKEKEKNEILGKLDCLLEGQSSSRKQIEELTKTNKELNVTIKELKKELGKKDKLIADLQDRLSRRNADLFGSKSQKGGATGKARDQRSREQDRDDFDGTPGSISADAGDKDSQTGAQPEKKSRTQAQLRADILRTGSSYRKMGASETICHDSDLNRLPEGAKVLKIVEQFAYEQVVSLIEHKYQLVTYKDADGRIKTGFFPTEGEIQYIDRVPGTKASSEMLANLIFNRFGISVPLYREWERLTDLGMTLSRKTLTNWLYKGSLLFSPLVEELKKSALEKDSIVNCDETWCKVRVNDRYSKKYIWCLVNKESRTAIYCYEDGSRGRDALKNILGDSDLLALQSDGYNVYFYLDKDLVATDHLCCMQHARAKFVYAADAGDKDAEYMVKWIGELYRLEDTYKKMGLTPDQIKKARNNARTIETVGILRSKLNVLMAPDHPPRSELMDKAVNYMFNFWDQLFRYRENGRYSIDNNIAERAIRPLTVERKNSLFFGSDKMAVASTIYHTVVSTCKMQKVRVLDYLKTFFRKYVEGERDYSRLLPNTIGLSVNNP